MDAKRKKVKRGECDQDDTRRPDSSQTTSLPGSQFSLSTTTSGTQLQILPYQNSEHLALRCYKGVKEWMAPAKKMVEELMMRFDLCEEEVGLAANPVELKILHICRIFDL